jgi:hypothetical protein
MEGRDRIVSRRDNKRSGQLRMKACRWVPEHLRNMNMGQDSPDRNGRWGQDGLNWFHRRDSEGLMVRNDR